MSPRLSWFALLAVPLLTRPAATPSTNFWAPSTAALQGFGVLHVTYDTYFGSDAMYPIDLGLTMGLLPWKQLQLEVGVDVVYPTLSEGEGLSAPLLFNAKIGTPEDALFENQPGWSAGIYNAGFEEDVTDYNVLYGVIGKTTPVGTLSLGAYYGLSDTLLVDMEGDAAQAGLLAGWFSPAIDAPLVDRIHLTADVQTGNNALGGAGGGITVYFTPAVALLTGPVFYFEPELQPGGADWMWSAQLDVDIDLGLASRDTP